MRLKNVTEVLDKETGEIITTSKSFSVATNSENFYITFIGKLAGFYSLKSAVDIKVLVQLCERAQFDNGLALIPPAIRKEMMTTLDVSSQQITKSLANLKSKGLITGERGAYTISPLVFWKGSMDARESLLNNKLSIQIDFENE